MNNKLLITIFCILFFIFMCFSIPFAEYLYTQHKNKKSTSYCLQHGSYECNIRMFELILPYLLIYTPIKDKKIINFAKMDDNDLLWQPFISYETANFYIDYIEINPLANTNIFDFYYFYAQDKFKLKTYKFFVPSLSYKEQYRKNFFYWNKWAGHSGSY